MADLGILAARAEIVRKIRAFFDGQGFLEVETPVRIAAPAPEEHIDCPPVTGGGFLRASPELQMKKLIAAGAERLYQIGPCFREGERGSRHNPEFTMIEWYRRNATYRAIMDDLRALCTDCLGGVFAGREFAECDVREMYREHAGWDPWTAWDQDRFDYDMATKIEPALAARGGGVFLTDYPRQAASLARVEGDHAERWEFYWNGMELANCFTELCDGAEQRARFLKAKAARAELGEADYPIDNEFLDRVDAMESAAGVALGVDRLVMVMLGATAISQVRVGEFLENLALEEEHE